MRARIRFAAIVLSGLLTGFGHQAAADDDIFSIQEIDSPGRVVTAKFADFDGDQRIDLMLVSLAGIPPKESRTISVYLGQDDGVFGAAPSHSLPLPPSSTVYDVADLKDAPGEELVLLRPDGVTIFSIANSTGRLWHLPVSGPSTVGAADDERGFDPFHMVYDEFGSEPWILVPQIGVMSAISTDGTLMAQIEVGQRANYFIASPSGPFSVESDIQLYLDVPKLTVGDVNGDGANDIVTTTRHEIRVFLRDADGSFPRQADQTIAIGLISSRDHIRGSGSVVSTLQDMNGDGRLDLMIAHVEGSFAEAVTSTTIFHNRDGLWNLAEPDDEFVSDGILGSSLLVDIDQDGLPDLVRIQLRFSVFEIIELLLTQEMDTRVLVHRLEPDGHFATKPWVKKKISTGIDFDTFRPKGFLPPTGLDLNDDGRMDFITSTNGKGIAVYLGSDVKPYARRSAMQKFPTVGVIHFADFDDDGLPDFALFDSQKPEGVVRIGRNLGTLPGSSRRGGDE